MPTEYESERTVTREQAAATLREMADGIAAGSLLVGESDESVTVGIPDAIALEIELETDDGDRSVELELEWPEGGSPERNSMEQNEAGPVSSESATVEKGTSEPQPSDRASVAAGATGEDASDDSDTSNEREAVPVSSTQPPRSLARFELFRDKSDEWRWRLVHRNGNVIATSGEGYTRKHNAEKGLRSVVRNAPNADVIDDVSE